MPAGDPAVRIATLADLIAADAEGRRCEIIAGQLVQKEMGGERHAGAQSGVLLGIGPAFRGRGDGTRPGGWVFLIEPTIATEGSDILQPDLGGWRRETAPADDSYPITPAPDWVCEIVYSTHTKDLSYKPPVYHAMRIGHYWVVDLKSGLLTVYRWGEAGYTLVTSQPAKAVARLEPFDAIALNVWELFGLEEAPGDEPRRP